MTRPIRRARPICRQCYRRPALASVRGKWRVVEHHDVCRQCWRSLMDAVRAWKLAGCSWQGDARVEERIELRGAA